LERKKRRREKEREGKEKGYLFEKMDPGFLSGPSPSLSLPKLKKICCRLKVADGLKLLPNYQNIQPILYINCYNFNKQVAK